MTAKFITSALSLEDFPTLLTPFGAPLPEIVFVGRSNVGKSSLINHLTQAKKLAKTSSTPGKTQMINFFTLDDRLALVDLPGYGYAQTSKEKKATWSKAIELYLEKRQNLFLILLLLDARRIPTAEDIAFTKWAEHYSRPYLIVFTKSDKATEKEKRDNLKIALDLLGAPQAYLYYSIKDAKARLKLLDFIKRKEKNGPS